MKSALRRRLSMLPFWCFSVLLLSAVLGLPLHTDNSTSGCNGSFCNQTQNYTERYLDSPPARHPMVGFWLPTMNIHRLDNALRPGDVQKVDTWSPHSPGKK